MTLTDTAAHPLPRTDAARAAVPVAAPRDVLVLSLAPIGYRVTDLLRAPRPRLKVASELVPPRASWDRVRRHVEADLADPGTLASWRGAAAVVTMFGSGDHAAELEDMVATALARDRGTHREPPWLQLSPHPHHCPGSHVLDAPVIMNQVMEEVYLPTASRVTLVREIQSRRALRAPAYRQTLRALLGLPTPPPGWREWAPC